MNNNVKKNFVYNLIKSFSQVIFPLITFPYISRTLLPGIIGKIDFGNSIVNYISLIATLGVSTYAVRECSKVKEDKKKLEETAGQILSINIVTTILAYLILAILLLCFRSFDAYRVVIILLSSTVLFSTLGADWINTTMEDFKYITFRTFFFQLFSLIAMFVFVHEPDDYLKYVLISIISTSGANILNIFYRKKYCKIRFTFHIDWKKHFPPIVLLFSMIVFQTIFCNSDITILGLIKGDYQVGLYSTSVKIYNIVNTTLASVALVVIPKMSYYFASENYEEVNKLFKQVLSFIVTLGIPCVVGIIMMASEIIEMIAGKEYLGAVPSLRILSIALALSLLAGAIGNTLLLPAMKEAVCVKTCAVAALVNIVTNIICIPIWGLNAAAVTTVLAELLSVLVYIRNIDEKIKVANIKSILCAPVIGGIAICFICLGFKMILHNLWIRTIVTVLVSAIMYVVILVALKNELLLSYLKPLIKKKNK